MSTPTPPIESTAPVPAPGPAQLLSRITPVAWAAIGVVVLLLGVMLTCAFSGGPKTGYDADLLKDDPAQGLRKMAAALHPDWQVAWTDDHDLTVTMIDKSTGKPMTFKLDQDKKVLAVTATEVRAAKGTPDAPAAPAQDASAPQPQGQAQVSAPGSSTPAWVPVYPGTSPELKSFAQTQLDGNQSIFTFKTADAPVKVIAFFQEQLKTAGFKITQAAGGEQGGTVQAEDAQQKRSMILGVEEGENGDGSKGRVVVVEKK